MRQLGNIQENGWETLCVGGETDAVQATGTAKATGTATAPRTATEIAIGDGEKATAIDHQPLTPQRPPEQVGRVGPFRPRTRRGPKAVGCHLR